MTADLTGEDRCWPCTVANGSIGLLVAWLPLAAALVEGEPAVVRAAVGWGVVVTAVTGYRLVDRGYLPLAESAAKLTGLHGRIGPGSTSEHDTDPEEK